MKPTAVDKAVAFICVLTMFASPYDFAGSPLALWLGLVASLLSILYHKKLSLPEGYVYFFVYVMTVPQIATLLTGLPGDTVTTLLPRIWLVFTAMMLVMNETLDWESVLKFYKYAAYACVIFFWIQDLSYLAFGRRPVLYIPFLTNRYEERGMSSAYFAISRAFMDRSSSFFLEPAHYVQFIFPYFAMKTGEAVEKGKFGKEFWIFLLAVLTARSGCGYMMLAGLFLYVFIISDVISVKSKALYALLGFIVVFVTLNFFSDTQFVSYILGRSGEISITVDDESGQSGFIRMFRGFYIFLSMPFANQIFGVGAGSLDYVSTLISEENAVGAGTFMNGFQSLLCRGGIFGTLLFFAFINSILKKCDFSGRCVLVSMVCLMFMEWFLCDAKMFLYILLAFCLLRQNESLEEEQADEDGDEENVTIEDADEKESVHCP